MDTSGLNRADLFVHARRQISPLLTPPANAMLCNMDPELTTLDLALKEIFKLFVAGHKTHVGSAETFVLSTTDVFSAQYGEYFMERAAWFDRISGFEESPTNAFLSLEPLGALLGRVADGMATTAEDIAAAKLSGSPTTTAVSSAVTRIPLVQQVPYSVGASISQQDDPDSNSEKASSGCPIINIELSGKTICAAWRANAITKGMEDDATESVRRDPFWAPSQTAHLAVYHGTTGPQSGGSNFAEFADALAHFDTTSVLRGSVSPNQVAPMHSSLPIVWTSFSPLRAFLWATFVSEVLSDIPQNTVGKRMGQTYVCPQPPLHTHSGVRLLEFRPRLFDSDEQRAFVMPRGVEDQWCRLANQSASLAASLARESDSTAPIWDIFSRHHGETSGQGWPQVIHCHEATAHATMLRHFTRQLWRTVWYGSGITELNRSRQRIFSISFRCFTTPTSNPITSATSSDDRETLTKS